MIGTATALDRSALLDWYRRNRQRSRQLFDLVRPEAYYSRPIALRHPIVFYEGHLPAFSVNARVLSIFLAFVSSEFQFGCVGLSAQRLVLVSETRDLDALLTQLIVRSSEISLSQLTRTLFFVQRRTQLRNFTLRRFSTLLRTPHSLIASSNLFTTHTRSASFNSDLFSVCAGGRRLASEHINFRRCLLQAPRLLSFL